MELKEMNKEEKQMNNVEKDKVVKSKSFPLLPLIVKVMVLLIIMVVAMLVVSKNFFKQSVKAQVSSILVDEKIISQLSTLIVPYAGIYDEYDDKGKKIRSTSYKGTITYSIDFSKITFTDDNEKKVVTINIPKINDINKDDVYIEAKSIKTIPIEDDINNIQLRISQCKNDLIEKFKNDKTNINLAEESTEDTIKNFFKPIIESIDKDYTIEVKCDEDV